MRKKRTRWEWLKQKWHLIWCKQQNKIKKFSKLVVDCLLFAVVIFLVVTGNFYGDTLEKKVYEVKAMEKEPVPNRTGAPLMKIQKIKKLIAEHTISNPASSKERNWNMKLAAEIINGMIFRPSDLFSWLEIVGDTTSEKGFLKAPVVYGKQIDSDFGGGVCQVTSTIYSAAIKAGLETHAHKHSLSSSYIHEKRGDREAAVAFSSKMDFCFRNSLNNSIELQVVVQGGSVTAKFFEVTYQEVRV